MMLNSAQNSVGDDRACHQLRFGAWYEQKQTDFRRKPQVMHSISEDFRRKAEQFLPYLKKTRRILSLNALQRLENQQGYLRLRACSELKFVSRHAQILINDTP